MTLFRIGVLTVLTQFSAGCVEVPLDLADLVGNAILADGDTQDTEDTDWEADEDGSDEEENFNAASENSVGDSFEDPAAQEDEDAAGAEDEEMTISVANEDIALEGVEADTDDAAQTPIEDVANVAEAGVTDDANDQVAEIPAEQSAPTEEVAIDESGNADAARMSADASARSRSGMTVDEISETESGDLTDREVMHLPVTIAKDQEDDGEKGSHGRGTGSDYGPTSGGDSSRLCHSRRENAMGLIAVFGEESYYIPQESEQASAGGFIVFKPLAPAKTTGVESSDDDETEHVFFPGLAGKDLWQEEEGVVSVRPIVCQKRITPSPGASLYAWFYVTDADLESMTLETGNYLTMPFGVKIWSLDYALHVANVESGAFEIVWEDFLIEEDSAAVGLPYFKIAEME